MANNPMYTQPLPDWRQLSLQQQVAQLVVVRTTGHLFDSQMRYPQWEAPNPQLRHWIEDLGIGGVILLGGSAPEVALRTQRLQQWSQIPLLISADIEEGVGRRFPGATWMPPPLALGDIAQNTVDQACDYAYELGKITAQEAWAIGLNWILAPVVDVNNNPKNPAINVRSFGETPDVVIPLIENFIQGTQVHPILTTAKHFPGHGDTAIDPHLELPLIPHSRTRLEQVELAPFRAAIAAGVSTVMTAHLRVPALDPEQPASLSSLTLTNLLRHEMGFTGLVVTDALVMQAITGHYGAYEAPIMALEAGSDIILMPVDPPGTIDAVCQAIQTGRLSLEQIHHSLDRLWQAKRQVYASTVPPELDHTKESTLPQLFCASKIAQPEATKTCQMILRQSLKVLPGKATKTVQPPSGSDGFRQDGPAGAIAAAINLIVVDNLLEVPYLGMHTPAVRLPQTWGYRLQWFDSQMPAAVETVKLQQPTLLQLFIRANPFQDTAGSVQTAQFLIQSLLTAEQLQGLILYGSPYVWEELKAVFPSSLPAIFSYGQMPMAQTIALEEMLKLGLTIPDAGYSSEKFTT